MRPTTEQRNKEVSKLIAFLETCPRGVPQNKERLIDACQCDPKKLSNNIAIARKRIEHGKTRKLCNLRGLGYWISRSTEEDLDECLKECHRSVGHLLRASQTITQIVEPNQEAKTDEDSEIFSICAGIVEALPEELRQRLQALIFSRMPKVRERAALAKNSVAAPEWHEADMPDADCDSEHELEDEFEDA